MWPSIVWPAAGPLPGLPEDGGNNDGLELSKQTISLWNAGIIFWQVEKKLLRMVATNVMLIYNASWWDSVTLYSSLMYYMATKRLNCIQTKMLQCEPKYSID